MAMVVSTSGNLPSAASISLEISMDWSSEVEGIEVTRHMMEPSWSWGMNSLPSSGNSARLPTSNATAATTTVVLCASDQASSGR